MKGGLVHLLGFTSMFSTESVHNVDTPTPGDHGAEGVCHTGSKRTFNSMEREKTELCYFHACVGLCTALCVQERVLIGPERQNQQGVMGQLETTVIEG